MYVGNLHSTMYWAQWCTFWEYDIGGPCIIPFYVSEKFGVMQDTMYRAILNGAIQWIYCIKMVQSKDFDLFENGTTVKH